MDSLDPGQMAKPPEPMTGLRALRSRAFIELEPRMHPEGLSLANKIIVFFIVAASALAIIETEPTLDGPYGRWFNLAETVLGVVFAAEYLARVWAQADNGQRGYGWKARLKFMVSPSAIVDLLATIASFTPAGHGALILRVVRLLRILRLAKLGRMSQAWDHMIDAVASRREELILSLFIGMGLMVASASALYLVEGDVQPDKFGSIPRALWWAVATMTTIGYGDVYPVTPLGRFLAALTALTSIGLIAMPAGILASAFSEAVQKHKAHKSGH